MTKQQYMKDYREEYKRRNRFVKFSVSRAVFAQLEKAAKQEDTKPNTLARALLLSSLDNEVYQPGAVLAELRALRFLVRGIANNINQMAHHSNLLRMVVDERGLFNELAELERSVEAFTALRLRSAHDCQINE